jgi:hypothetical protein
MGKIPRSQGVIEAVSGRGWHLVDDILRLATPVQQSLCVSIILGIRMVLIWC